MKPILSLALLVLLLGAVAPSTYARTWQVKSPDGRTTVSIESTAEGTAYSVSRDGIRLLQPSRLSLTLDDGRQLGSGLVLSQVATMRDKRTTPIYQRAGIDEQYRLIRLTGKGCAIEWRVYNGGVAYRFVTSASDSLTVRNELTEYRFAGRPQLTYLPLDNMFTDFQNFYRTALLDTISHPQLMASQVLLQWDNGPRALLTDYDVDDYPVLFLKTKDGILQGQYPRYPDREQVHGKMKSRLRVVSTRDYIARIAGQRTLPWRVMLLADSDAQLAGSDVVYSLAPAPQGDFSWVKPGKATWEWWNAYGLEGTSFLPGVNDSTYFAYIDFAARHGLPYILIDAGWTKLQDPLDLLQTTADIHLPQLAAYARQRGVGIVLWADYFPFSRQMEEVVRRYTEMGIVGFKIDHINRADQKVVRFCRQAAEMCARYHAFIDFHGVFPPTGLQVTMPNVLNYEAVMGLEVTKFREGYDLVAHECYVPFIRQVAGPIDYTQGAMRNVTQSQFHKDNTHPMSQGTRCRQLAEYVVFLSPFNMLCDAPPQYERNPESLAFISEVPVTWDDTRVLQGEAGKYIVVARRKGSRWYIGGLTDWQPRTLSLNLSFASAKHMRLYEDGPDAASDATSLKVSEIAPAQQLNVKAAPGGGFVLVIETEAR